MGEESRRKNAGIQSCFRHSLVERASGRRVAVSQIRSCFPQPVNLLRVPGGQEQAVGVALGAGSSLPPGWSWRGYNVHQAEAGTLLLEAATWALELDEG